ncbi:MAG: hypothetical protein KDA86_24985 [Planctomycetaceae bacterium]|nr:hypothetical protein [Planctomycetaceae bacterium]MCA9110116.1 hypothetical protein [Planctomycetaceae bacterium]
MQFSFEVDPNLDVAIGLEADFIEGHDSEYSTEPVDEFVALMPTEAKPGSEDKVRMLSARYAAGVPLWHESDCYDHGPDSLEQDEFDLEEEDF